MPNEMDHFTTDHCGSKYQVKLEMRTIAEFEHKSDRDLFMSALRNLQPASNNELTDCQRRVKELEGLLASHEQQLESEQISKGNLIRDNHQLKKRVAELEKICTMDGIEDLIATRDRQRTLIQKAHDELGDSDIKKELARELVAFMLEHGIVKEKDYSVRKL